MFGVSDPFSKMLADRDVLALRNVAGWLEKLTEATRRPSDPLIVKKNRGDAVVRGVQIVAAQKLKECFGNHLHGTAARRRNRCKRPVQQVIAGGAAGTRNGNCIRGALRGRKGDAALQGSAVFQVPAP
jgi:hypothetical protein